MSTDPAGGGVPWSLYGQVRLWTELEREEVLNRVRAAIADGRVRGEVMDGDLVQIETGSAGNPLRIRTRPTRSVGGTFLPVEVDHGSLGCVVSVLFTPLSWIPMVIYTRQLLRRVVRVLGTLVEARPVTVEELGALQTVGRPDVPGAEHHAPPMVRMRGEGDSVQLFLIDDYGHRDGRVRLKIDETGLFMATQWWHDRVSWDAFARAVAKKGRLEIRRHDGPPIPLRARAMLASDLEWVARWLNHRYGAEPEERQAVHEAARSMMQRETP